MSKDKKLQPSPPKMIRYEVGKTKSVDHAGREPIRPIRTIKPLKPETSGNN
ncbi:MAG: hypothetical protein MI740_06660 [Halanaerobiales bacterium]|nr:hypothetical protein [Halanaerobiales bacterium]